MYRRLGAVLLCSLAFASCVSSRMSDREIDRLFLEGRFEDAAARLKAGYEEHGEESGNDSLLYLLDLGLAYHYAGKEEEAIKVFRHADHVAEIKDWRVQKFAKP